MEITPIEIRNYKFRKQLFNGLDEDHVMSFLQQIADEVADLSAKNNAMATKIKELTGQVGHYKKIEHTMNETLMTAQRATDDARANAQKEAELILKDAQVRADRYEDETRSRIHELTGEIRSLQAQKESFLARFRAMLRDQLSYLDVMGGHLDDDDASHDDE
ncbi:DivIVA domain-containing protein [Chitinivibrio alkaliphilus]|uniref:Cell-division initiation protein n=1 Tax=Chitinivibrio alkaliphilus ACht1 TaxID=1313304 RepID=U7D9K5_9BACT|nr:DivIVA domain-containing protein [Chitinivibrio alkaliphilus]ERP39074.1 cell-division initiation protein [Chitinivibrio alkaliphilus ACht1]